MAMKGESDIFNHNTHSGRNENDNNTSYKMNKNMV